MKSHNFTIASEQTSRLYGALKNSIFATVINSIILTAVLWSFISQTILLTWLGSILIISLARGFMAYQYKKVSPKPVEVDIWRQRFLFGSIASAVMWGSSSIFLFPTDDLPRQVFLAFVIGGMAAGSITSLSYIKLAVYSFLCITLVPLLIRFFYSENELSIAMGSMITLYFVVLLQAAKQSFTTNIQNISMRIKNIQQQQSLNESEHRYETLLETATDAFFLHDLNGKFINVNNQACLSLGYSKNELLKMSVADILVQTEEEKANNVWADLKEGDNIHLEGIHRRKNGTTFPVEASLGLIVIKDEPFLSVLARDVTERKRIDKMKNEFVSTVSHELRTPLTSIRGSLGLITGGALGELPTEAKEMLELASNNSERLLLLINDILDIQKIESGQLEMEFENFKIIPFLNHALEDNTAYAKQYGVKFVLETKPDDINIYADKARLMQVMANLLSNAAKFSIENGVVEVSVDLQHDDVVRISVNDHGIGIPKEFHSKVFDKFTQQDSSDTRKKGGTGLGLNISKAIVEKHGGHIGFTSTEGLGSTFYFEIPVNNQ